MNSRKMHARINLIYTGICLRNNLFYRPELIDAPPTMAMMAAPLVGREELSHETNLREGCKNVWTKLCEGGGKSRGSKGGQNHRTSRTLRCPPPGASWRPKNHTNLSPEPSSSARTRARVPAMWPCQPPKWPREPAYKQRQVSVVNIQLLQATEAPNSRAVRHRTVAREGTEQSRGKAQNSRAGRHRTVAREGTEQSRGLQTWTRGRAHRRLREEERRR